MKLDDSVKGLLKRPPDETRGPELIEIIGFWLLSE
jgi:hypothetical protein